MPLPCHCSWLWGIPALVQPALLGAVSCKGANSVRRVGSLAERGMASHGRHAQSALIMGCGE